MFDLHRFVRSNDVAKRETLLSEPRDLEKKRDVLSSVSMNYFIPKSIPVKMKLKSVNIHYHTLSLARIPCDHVNTKSCYIIRGIRRSNNEFSSSTGIDTQCTSRTGNQRFYLLCGDDSQSLISHAT